MAISLAFIMGFIGASVAMLIGIMIFAQVDDAVDCTQINNADFQAECESTKSMAWTVIGILPIALFFVMFQVFGGLGFGRDDDDDEVYQPLESVTERAVKKVKSYIHWNPDGSIKGTKKPQLTDKLSLKQKILITMGFAKVKKRA